MAKVSTMVFVSAQEIREHIIAECRRSTTNEFAVKFFGVGGLEFRAEVQARGFNMQGLSDIAVAIAKNAAAIKGACVPKTRAVISQGAVDAVDAGVNLNGIEVSFEGRA